MQTFFSKLTQRLLRNSFCFVLFRIPLYFLLFILTLNIIYSISSTHIRLREIQTEHKKPRDG